MARLEKQFESATVEWSTPKIFYEGRRWACTEVERCLLDEPALWSCDGTMVKEGS